MKNKIGLFIDQANLWSAYKKVGKIIDFKKQLVSVMKNNFNILLKKNSHDTN